MDSSCNALIFTSVILNKHGIKYWLCNGTLLGIIRDNSLMPWDHDIDFGVFYSNASKDKIRSIMNNHGFTEELINENNDCLHFLLDDAKVDINFFSIENNLAFCKWIVVNDGIFNKFKSFILNYNEYYACRKKLNIIGHCRKLTKNIIRYVISTLRNVSPSFTRYLKKLFRQGTFRKTGYSYPASLLSEFTYVDFMGHSFTVPCQCKLYLEHTYGKKWKIPNKSYTWHTDADNLV